MAKRTKTFYAVIQITAEIDDNVSALEAEQQIEEDADYGISYDEGGVKVVETEWMATTRKMPVV